MNMNICVTCICTADERLNRRKDSCGYLVVETIVDYKRTGFSVTSLDVSKILLLNLPVWKVQSCVPQGLYCCCKEMPKVHKEEKTAICQTSYSSCPGI